jgi:hypothetical protein
MKTCSILDATSLANCRSKERPDAASAIAIGDGQDRPADVFGQFRPGIDQPDEFGREPGPLCATSVQPETLLGRKIRLAFAL